MFRSLIAILLVQVLTFETQAAWILKRTRSKDQIQPIGISQYQVKSLEIEKLVLPKTLTSLPEFLVEHEPSSSKIYEEILWPYDAAPSEYNQFMKSVESEIAGSEFRTIAEQGPSQNRICLTFLGDGYTEPEKEKFFADVAAMVDDLFNGQTFQSYKALFNIYAVFVPSKESGITDLQQKNTAFGLYRSPAGSKRAIMPGNTSAIERAIALAPKTDYPIIIANDNFYGGLGGRYAITSSSRESGKIVLRHELGHNFGSVGEEYDGGSVYSGANSSRGADVPWKQWLQPQQNKIVNDMRFLGGAYVWQNLAQKSVVQDFTFPAPNQKGAFWFEVQVSSVGWQSLDDVEILLDGRKLEILGHGTADRSFFNTLRIQDLPPGKHTLEIREINHDGDNILAFANLYAYEADYDFNGGLGAFKTYDDFGGMTYRPTHQHCLMRDMLYEFFCSVDQENMWFQFLNRIRLVDSVQVTTDKVQVKTLALAGLAINWFKKDGNQEVELTDLKNLSQFERSKLVPGQYVVKVQFSSAEIRKTSDRLKDRFSFDIP